MYLRSFDRQYNPFLDQVFYRADKRRNRAISRVRSLVERPFAVIKRVFHSGHLMVTTHLRVHARMLFACFSYNLFNLVSIRNRPIER